MAITAVILLHTLPTETQLAIHAAFHIAQAVPIFFILMGITFTISFTRQGVKDIRSAYSGARLFQRLERVLVPFAIVWLVSLVGGLLMNGTISMGWLSLIGLLPYSGPGNYFVTILVQFVLLAPAIFVLHRRSPTATLLLLFSLDLAFELSAPHVPLFSTVPYVYSASIFRYLWGIALGFYISDQIVEQERLKLLSRRNFFIIPLFIVSIAYLHLSLHERQPFPWFLEVWGHQNIISFAYPLTIIAITANLWHWWRARLRRRAGNRLASFAGHSILRVGKASYYIFLVQILFFAFGLSFAKYEISQNAFANWFAVAVLNIICTFSIGLVFHYAEQNASGRLRAIGSRLLSSLLGKKVVRPQRRD